MSLTCCAQEAKQYAFAGYQGKSRNGRASRDIWCCARFAIADIGRAVYEEPRGMVVNRSRICFNVSAIKTLLG